VKGRGAKRACPDKLGDARLPTFLLVYLEVVGGAAKLNADVSLRFLESAERGFASPIFDPCGV
jgi:hypothetical protein